MFVLSVARQALCVLRARGNAPATPGLRLHYATPLFAHRFIIRRISSLVVNGVADEFALWIRRS